MPRRVRVALVLLTLHWLAACGIPTEDGATRVDDAAVPGGLLEPEETTAVPETTARQPATVPASIYLIDGELLLGVERTVSDGTAMTLIDSLLVGPTDAEAEDGIRSALVSDDVVSSTELRGRTLAIDLRAEFADAPPTEQRLALAQLTFTATEDPLVNSVAFTLEREAISVPRGDGTTSDGPVQRADYQTLAPQAAIDT
jgi:Sporulation and spore germination